VGFAVSVVLVKSLTRTDRRSQVIFWMLVVQSLIGLVPALLVWRRRHGRRPGAGWWWWPFAARFRTTA
jgi:drug/metabolite transporter (DMT)-like permease